jgi:hypothetical protein
MAAAAGDEQKAQRFGRIRRRAGKRRQENCSCGHKNAGQKLFVHGLCLTLDDLFGKDFSADSGQRLALVLVLGL